MIGGIKLKVKVQIERSASQRYVYSFGGVTGNFCFGEALSENYSIRVITVKLLLFIRNFRLERLVTEFIGFLMRDD